MTSAMAPEIRDSKRFSAKRSAKRSAIDAGVSYCLMLTFGTFALADYNTYGVGVMEVGTFYALCKIYLSPLAKKESQKTHKGTGQRNVMKRGSGEFTERQRSLVEAFWIHGMAWSRSVP